MYLFQLRSCIVYHQVSYLSCQVRDLYDFSVLWSYVYESALELRASWDIVLVLHYELVQRQLQAIVVQRSVWQVRYWV